jgi:hypothetical protein
LPPPQFLCTPIKAFQRLGSSTSPAARWKYTAGLHRPAIEKSGVYAEKTRSPLSLSQT